MAVYDHGYRRYVGERTSSLERLLVFPRYAYRDIFSSKLLMFIFALSLLPPIVEAVILYARHKAELLEAMGFDISQELTIGAGFFDVSLFIQTIVCAFLLTLFAGPSLISRDLADNGLALYFSRPISRTEYVLGKLLVLGALLSSITWVPCLILFGIQSNLQGWDWFVENLRIGIALFVGAWVWILLISLLALALSAWVKWRAAAALAMLMVFLSGSFFAHLINELFRTDWGHVVNLWVLVIIVFDQLFGTAPADGPPVLVAWIALAFFCGACLLLINRKLRAYEVVR